jgi:hypothetical protein
MSIAKSAAIPEGEKMPEIQSLTLRVQNLSQSVDWWNTAMIWGLALAAIAAVFVVVATRVVVTRSGQLSAAQDLLTDAKDRQLRLDLSDKDVKIADAQKAAGEANERAAAATETAERERLARLQLEARLADRVLPEAQQRLMTDAMRPLGRFSTQVFWYSDTTEVTRLSNSIIAALAAAGWEVAGAHAQGGVTVQGIVIAVRRDVARDVREAAIRIVSELGRNNIPASFSPTALEQIPGPGMSFGNTIPNPQIRIMIGNK